MEKNSMELMNEALEILQQKFGGRPDLAYASLVGYATAAVDLKTARFILDCVKESN